MLTPLLLLLLLQAGRHVLPRLGMHSSSNASLIEQFQPHPHHVISTDDPVFMLITSSQAIACKLQAGKLPWQPAKLATS
jgi:hypothetical protein